MVPQNGDGTCLIGASCLLPQIGTCHIMAINGFDSGPEIRPRTRKTSSHNSAVYSIRILVYLEDIK